MSFLNKVTVEDLDVKGRRVLVRVDFNVPLKDGKVTNDNRIVGAIPTIRYLADHGAKVILCSHLGKPKGPDAAFTMAPVAARLGELMGRPVLFADDDTVVGENARRMVSEMKDGDILVLQNTRFRPEETKNLPEFSKELASLADVYVDDAFGSAHRAHCSTVGDRLHQGDRCGLPDGEGDQLPGQCRGAAGASSRGHPGRRQGGR